MNTMIPMLALSGGVVVAIAIAVGVLLLIIIVVAMYNKLVRLRQSCKESWADIDTELQRRHDLIPNLIDTVKGYATHEKSVLEEVTNLRNQAVADKDKGPAERAKVEDQLGKAAGGLVATFEAYPDLKANQNFLQLQNELGENRDPHRTLPPLLQRQRPRLHEWRPDVPQQPRRRHGRLQGQRVRILQSRRIGTGSREGRLWCLRSTTPVRMLAMQ